jgi:hypothetical protein
MVLTALRTRRDFGIVIGHIPQERRKSLSTTVAYDFLFAHRGFD